MNWLSEKIFTVYYYIDKYDLRGFSTLKKQGNNNKRESKNEKINRFQFFF